jgi:hypothetical protein
MIFKRVLSLLSLSAIALPSITANAATPPGVFKDSSGNVYVHTGVTSGSKVEVALVGTALTKKIRAGYCGQISLTPSTSLPSLGNSVTINGTTVNLATISTVATAPSCSSNTFTPATTTPFKLASGKVVLVGYTAGTSYEVKFNDLPASANATVNACNFALIRNTTKRPLPSQIKVNGTSYTISTLTTADPPLCRKDSSTGISTKYVPGTW